MFRTMNSRKPVVLTMALAGVAIVPLPAEVAPQLRSSTRLEERKPGTSIDSMVTELTARAADAGDGAWFGWHVPALNRSADICCYRDWSKHTKGDRGCDLEERNGKGRRGNVNVNTNTIHHDSNPGPSSAELTPGLVIAVRVGARGVEEVRPLSADCPFSAGASFAWLPDVPVSTSGSWLRDFVNDAASGAGRDRSHNGALAGLAAHDLPAVTGWLENWALDRTRSEDLRGEAVFWLGVARGVPGFAALDRLLAAGSAPAEKIVFALSQSPVAAAGARLERLVVEERDPEIRQEAVFWWGQRAGVAASATLRRAAESDPNEDVRRKAIFALSQLPAPAAATELIALVRSRRVSEDLRREALFWLGQSNDPAAEKFLEDILLR